MCSAISSFFDLIWNARQRQYACLSAASSDTISHLADIFSVNSGYLSNVKNLSKSQESNITCVFHFIKSYPSRTFSHFKNVCWFVGKLNLIITQLKYVLIKKAWIQENGKTIITDWSVSQYFHYAFYCGGSQVNYITWI